MNISEDYTKSRLTIVFETFGDSFFWLARLVGNEGPSTFTGWYIGDETSLIPYG